MKKIFVTIGLILGLVISANATSYKELMISKEASSVFKSLRKSRDFTPVKTYDGLYYYALQYNDLSAEFAYLPDAEIEDFASNELYNYKSKKTLKRGRYLQLNSSLFQNTNGVCRSFIKAVAPGFSENVTAKVAYGKRLFPYAEVKPGTIILSHVNKKKNIHGHIAVLLAIKKDYIWVMDQNAYIYRKEADKKEGIVGIHKIRFKKNVDSSNSLYYDTTNAYNYHVYRIKQGYINKYFKKEVRFNPHFT